MGYYLGLDGGGTKTAAVILDDGLNELGRGQGGPLNIASCSESVILGSIKKALGFALSDAKLPAETHFEGACAGVAGFSSTASRERFIREFPTLVRASLHLVEPDYRIAWWGASGGSTSVIVIAGTGAAAYGRTSDGQETKVDGRGFLLGDRGSGFNIGRFLLKNIVFRLDAGTPLSALEQTIMDQINAKTADDVVEWTYRDFSPAKIASLVVTVGQQADAGDEHAKIAISSAGDLLRKTAISCIKRLGGTAEMPVYLAGGLWQCTPLLRQRFENGHPRSIQPLAKLNCMEPLHDAAYGAALRAFSAAKERHS